MSIPFDKVLGVLLGQAVGDALGLPAEHKDRAWCQHKYRDGGPRTFERVERPSRGEVFEAGEWSDDTDQALILVDSWLANDCVNLQDVAKRLTEWAKTQKGMGSHTRTVLEQPDFLRDPDTAAYRVWNEGGRGAAPNGAVMRAAVCGLFDPNFDVVWEVAMSYARVTHTDPRCQISAAMVAGLVNLLVRGERIDAAIDVVYGKQARDPDGGFAIPEENTLWDGATQGFTFKPLQAAIRALRLLDELRPNASEARTVVPLLLARQIREGGDTDTNAAVTGAVLGAAVGCGPFYAIGTPLREAWLVERAKDLHARLEAK